MALVVSADRLKETLPGYSPEKSEQFHTESAKLADKQFYTALKENELESVVLMNGGTASGKTEFLATQLVNKPYIILDATLSSEEGAKIKLRSIVKAKKRPLVYSVIPDDLGRAFIAFLHRDRKFSPDHFYRTHSDSRRVLLWIIKNFPRIEVHIVESSYTKDQNLLFTGLVFDSQQELRKHVESIQLSETDIIQITNAELGK